MLKYKFYWNVHKLLNRSQTEPISTRSVVQLTMTTKGDHSRGNPFVRKCTDWLHYLLHYTHTHTSTICVRYQVLLATYYKAANANTHSFIPSVSSFYLWTLSIFYEVWELNSRNARIYVPSNIEWAITKQRHITTCLWLRLVCWWSR
jgi:hypothetical protein